MAHDRKIVLSGISLTKAKTNPTDMKAAMGIMDEIEDVLISSNFFEKASFSWIGLSIRYGLKYEDAPHYQGISKKYGDISLAIEIDTHDLIKASYEEVKKIFMIATLKSVIHLGQKYNLPVKDLEGLYKEI